jgi:hypothetical protein
MLLASDASSLSDTNSSPVSLSTVDASAYLAQLTSLTVARLSGEPARLDAESAQITRQMESFAFENYKSFIETSETVRVVSSRIGDVNASVASLLESLPTLVQACTDFCRAANDAVVARELNSVALQRHAQLLDLLEIPQLMHTCVAGGFLDEALELDAFAQKLLQQRGADVPVVAQLASEVRLASTMLVRQLHEQLRGPITLPACLRVVGYLKRLGIYSEHELRVSFLSSRDAWLAGVLAALPRDSAYGYLSRLADTARLHMFEIVTQYRAIFSTGAAGGSGSAAASAASDAGDSGDRGTTMLLHSWLVQRTTTFLAALRADLPNIGDGASIASLLDQCMYFGLSLGRAGADFRPLLAPLFSERIFQVFERAVTRATKRFVRRVRNESIQPPVDSASLHPAATSGAAAAAAGAVPVPHASLVAHTWLALLVNGWLAALNELRQCAVWQVANRCADVLTRACTEAAQALRAVADQRLLEGPEATHFQALCGVFCEHLLPFIADCFGAIYRDPGTNRRRRDWVNASEAKKLCAGLYTPTAGAPGAPSTTGGDMTEAAKR